MTCQLQSVYNQMPVTVQMNLCLFKYFWSCSCPHAHVCVNPNLSLIAQCDCYGFLNILIWLESPEIDFSTSGKMKRLVYPRDTIWKPPIILCILHYSTNHENDRSEETFCLYRRMMTSRSYLLYVIWRVWRCVITSSNIRRSLKMSHHRLIF